MKLLSIYLGMELAGIYLSRNEDIIYLSRNEAIIYLSRNGAGMLDLTWLTGNTLLSCGYDTCARLWDTR